MSGLPDLPKGLPTGLAAYLTKLGQQFEVTQADRGSPLMAKPTIQDLIDVGVLKANPTETLKANGKSFTLANARNWLASAIPTWFTSTLNPPTPSGLVVGLSGSSIVLAWDAWVSSYYQQTLIYRAAVNDLSLAVLIGSTTGTTYVDSLPDTGAAYFWIRHEAKSGRQSDFNAVSGTTVGNITASPAPTYVFDATDLVLSWPTPTSQLTVQFYIVRWGATFEGGTEVSTSNANTLRITANFGGTRRFWIAAVDVGNQLGLAGYVDVTVTPPAAAVASQAIQNDALVLSYSAARGSLPVAGFEIRHGADFASGAAVTSGGQSRFETTVNWQGLRTFWIAAVDSAGNFGAATQLVFNPTLPGAVTVSAQVIDNNVLLSWSQSAGTLPVASYQVDRNGAAIGTLAGRFTAIYETVGGSYTYGVTPIDSAGNLGARSTTTAFVSQPPDYVLFSDADSAFGGTKTNTAIDPATGGLICNIDTAETWESHFTSRGWTCPQDQIDAGYPLYLVGKTSGSYVETINYGALIPATKMTVTGTRIFDTGTLTVASTIEMGVDGVTFPQSFPGASSAYATNFSYARVTQAYSAAHTGTGLATDTASLAIIKPLNYRLDVKQKTVQGMVAAAAGDAGGTAVNIAGQFVDVASIVLTPLSTAPLTCVYDFVDAGNPTQFKVLVFNASGTRVSATVSYIIRGV